LDCGVISTLLITRIFVFLLSPQEWPKHIGAQYVKNYVLLHVIILIFYACLIVFARGSCIFLS